MTPAERAATAVNALLVERLQPAYLVLDPGFRIQGWSGPVARYGLSHLEPGAEVSEHLPLLVGAEPGIPLELPVVALGEASTPATVLLQPWGTDAPPWSLLVLLDAHEPHAAIQDAQQMGNEAHLLRERTEQLSTELRIANQRLSEAVEVAERASQARGAFIARMSHEFRTPLTTILGRLELEQERGTAGSDLRPVERAARHLLNLVNNLIDQARFDHDQWSPDYAECDPRALIEDLEALFRELAERRSLGFRSLGDARPPERVRLDATRVQQVLFNLLSNAFKFTRQGEVTLTTEWHETDRTLAVAVQDTGSGIPPAIRSRLFEPFVRGTEAGSPGSGLGLAISKALVEGLGGTLELDSTPGTGTRVRATFPEPRHEATTEPTPPTENRSAGLPNASLLIAEDDPDLVGFLQAALAPTGWTVTFATTGAEAMQLAFERPVDLVLMDRNLPDETGTRVAQRLRTAGFRAPLILMSASGGATERAEAENAGCDGYLRKPFAIPTLIATVRDALTGA